MKRTCLAAMLLVIAFACRSGGPPADPAASTTVLQGGTFINPGADPVPNALIVIQGAGSRARGRAPHAPTRPAPSQWISRARLLDQA